MPLVLDAGARSDSRAYRTELGAMVYGCDICQEVCPWNRGVEKRRQGMSGDDPHGVVSLADWLDREGAQLVEFHATVSTSPQRPRWLRRNALVACSNVGSPALVPSITRYANDDDAVLRDSARWALRRLAERAE